MAGEHTPGLDEEGRGEAFAEGLHALIAEHGPALTIAERSAFAMHMALAATDWVRANNLARAAIAKAKAQPTPEIGDR